MPTPKSHRRGQEEKNRRGKLTQKSSSFHYESPLTMPMSAQLQRPNTVPDLVSFRNLTGSASSPEERPKLTKLLLNVTIQGSLGPVQVVMSPELKVSDLIAAAIRQYSKEGRRPILLTAHPDGFDLHYTQFSLESLDREEKLMTLGSRNFFLCPKRSVMDREDDAVNGGSSLTTSSSSSSSTSSCSKEAGKATKTGGFNWLNFMEFLR